MPVDKEKAIGNLKEILERMQNDTDTALMHEYYKLFKKEVSFFKRSWTAAWLFKYYNERENPPSPQKQKSPKPEQNKTPLKKTITDKTANEKTIIEKTPPSALPEEESKRLFISIGKNRRLFPKDIISLIMSKTSAAREDIGIIRILDNYSFAQVSDAKADEIIEALSGQKFRGRTLTVNYAVPKTGETLEEN